MLWKSKKSYIFVFFISFISATQNLTFRAIARFAHSFIRCCCSNWFVAMAWSYFFYLAATYRCNSVNFWQGRTKSKHVPRLEITHVISIAEVPYVFAWYQKLSITLSCSYFDQSLSKLTTVIYKCNKSSHLPRMNDLNRPQPPLTQCQTSLSTRTTTNVGICNDNTWPGNDSKPAPPTYDESSRSQSSNSQHTKKSHFFVLFALHSWKTFALAPCTVSI